MNDGVEDFGPVTIVRARYGGIYEPGTWLAFPQHPNALPADWNGGDVACSQFWAAQRDMDLVGGGDTPQAAYEDLLRRLRRRTGARHPLPPEDQ